MRVVSDRASYKKTRIEQFFRHCFIMRIIKHISALLAIIYVYIGSGYAQTSSSPLVPISDTKTCKAPPQPQNGHWMLNQSQCSNTEQDCDISEGMNLGLGSYLIYSCNPGYRIKGSMNVSCIEGKWLNIPSCIEIRCQKLSTTSIIAHCIYNNEWVSCDYPVLPGTNAKLSCRDNYEYESNLPSRRRNFARCNKNGQWVPHPIICVPVCCPTPIPQTTEIIRTEVMRPLKLNGSTDSLERTMYIGSEYAQTSPSPLVSISDAKTCKAPPQPQNGHWKLHRSQCSNTEQDCDISEGMNLGVGSYLIYSCNPGYKIKGSMDVICSFEGKWLNIPSCIEIRCETLSTASINADCTYNNEWVSCDSPVIPGTSAKLSCRNSYQYESNLFSRGRNFVRCNENGQWVPEPIRCIPVCGIPLPNVTPLIANGVPAYNVTEFPWHASLYRDVQGKSKEFFCGASIIQENLLITTAHCIYDEYTRQAINPKKIYVATGNIFRDYESIFHNSLYVKKNQVKHIYIVCNYLGLLGDYKGDIAILELMQPFVLSSTLVPVCIDFISDRSVLEAGVTGKVAGFGRTAFGKPSAILQALTVPYIPFRQCKSVSQDANTQRYLTYDKFCGGYTNGSAVCDGDAGGGLVFKTNGLWYLRGIVSVSLGTILESETAHCDTNFYTLYTQVSNYIDWIQNIIANINHNQSYTSCTIKT